MSAEVFHIGGLRGLNLARFQTAAQIIAESMAHDAEYALHQMRQHLAAACQEPTYELGEAQVAMAANRLSAALRLAG